MLESQGHDKVPNLYWIPGTCENVIDATMESKDQQKGIRVSYTFRRQPQSRPITAWTLGLSNQLQFDWQLVALVSNPMYTFHVFCLRTTEHKKKSWKILDFLKTPLPHGNRSPCWNPTEKSERHVLRFAASWSGSPSSFNSLVAFVAFFLASACWSVIPLQILPSTIGAVSFLFTSNKKKHIGTSFLLVGSCHVATFVISCYFCCCHFSVIVAGWCWCCPTFAFLSCRFSARGFEALVTLGPGGAACQGFPSGPMRGQCNWLSTL